VTIAMIAIVSNPIGTTKQKATYTNNTVNLLV